MEARRILQWSCILVILDLNNLFGSFDLLVNNSQLVEEFQMPLPKSGSVDKHQLIYLFAMKIALTFPDLFSQTFKSVTLCEKIKISNKIFLLVNQCNNPNSSILMQIFLSGTLKYTMLY